MMLIFQGEAQAMQRGDSATCSFPRKPAMFTRTALLCVSLFAASAAFHPLQAAPTPNPDPSSALSEASALSIEGGVALVEGVVAGGSYVLVALEPLGEGVLAVFEATGSSVQFSLELSGAAAEFAGKQIGSVVEVAAMAGGSALMLAGEIIAFVPDQLSQSMHHRERLSP